MSLFSGIAKLVAGAAEIAAGILIEVGTLGGGTPLATMLIASGAGMALSGIGTLIVGNPQQSRGVTQRNPIQAWRQVNGRASVGGTLVYEFEWGGDTPTVDLVMVLACHPSQSVDEVLFDQQRIQIDTTAAPSGAASGSGTSFTPVQQTVNITSISRSNDVVTVVLSANIPYLTEGDPIRIQNVTSDLTLNGKFQVQQIVSRTGGSITFTYLSGGKAVSITSQGQALTQWADYGRTVYFEPLLGNQLLGFTFQGMLQGTPFRGDMGQFVSPNSPHNAGGNAQPNPWTQYCSLQGKTAVFLRLYLDPKYYSTGLPVISFRMHGKNNIYDPRLGACTGIQTAGIRAAGTGYQVYDVLNVNQGGATSDGQITVTSVNSSGAIETFAVTKYGTGHSVGTAISLAGGHGTGATLDIFTLTGADNCNVYTENSVLATADYLCNQVYGYKFQYGTDIDLTQLTADANVCDQTVALAAGGTEPMYTCNGQFDVTESRGKILQDLLTSCAGRPLPEFPMRIQPGYWQGPGSPALQVDLQAIAAGTIRWKSPVTIRELFNGVKGTFLSPFNKWQPTDYPPYAQDSLHGYSGPAQYGGDINLAADGGERRWRELHLPFTISPSMAQRIAKIELLRMRWAGSRQYQGGSTVQIGGSGTFMLNMAGYQFLTLDVFEATVASLGLTNQLVEVQDVRLKCEARPGAAGENVTAPLLGVEIDIRETDSSIYQWSTTEELSPEGYQQVSAFEGTVSETTPLPWSPGTFATELTSNIIVGATSVPVADASGIENGNYITIQADGTNPAENVKVTSGGGTVGAATLTTTATAHAHLTNSSTTLITVPGPAPMSGDALLLPASFAIEPIYDDDAQGNPATAVQISGTPPINALDTGVASPQITALAGTGGSLPAGQYVVAVTAYDSGAASHADTEYLEFAICTVAANGSIALTVTWGSGDDGGDIYMGLWSANGYVMHYQQTLAPGTTSVTLSTFSQETAGGPDPLFHHFGVVRQQVEHFGIWAEQVQAVTATTITFASFTAGDVGANDFAGRFLTLLAKYDSTVPVSVLNIPIASNTASSGSPPEFTVTIGAGADGNTLPDLTTLLAVGDLLACSPDCTFTSTGFGDLKFANAYSPTGADPTKEPGRVIVMLTGADAGDVQAIASVGTDINGHYTQWSLQGQFQTTPSTGDLFAICDAATFETPSAPISSRNSAGTATFQVPLPNLADTTWLFSVRTEDSSGNFGPDLNIPRRPLYFFGAQGTRTVNS